MPLLYRQLAADDSLMAGDTLMFVTSTQPVGEPWGMKSYAMPETLQRSDVITTSLIISFLLLSLLSITRHKSLKTLVSNFFLPTLASKEACTDGHSEWQRLMVAVLFCLQGAISIIAVTQIQGIVSLAFTPWLVLATYFVVLLLFVIAKQCLYRYVHSVFFSRRQRRRWREDYAFLFTLESILLFPLLLLIIYLHVSLEIVLYSVLAMLLFVKMLLLFKCFSTFFGKMYGILHLFVYFCTLEAAPLVVLWTILKDFTKGFYLL